MRRALLAVLLLILGSPVQAAPEPPDWGSWQQARTLFESGKFDAALSELQKYPTPDANFFYNVGTIYNRMGKIGVSVAYLEKANRLQPHDPAIQKNLQLARDDLGRLIGLDRLDPASTWAEGVADHVSLDEIRGTLGLLGSITLILWLQAYLRTRRLRKTLLQPAAVCTFVGFLITIGLYSVERMAEAHPPAACIERQVVRSGPGDRFLELSQLEAGSKLRVLGPIANAEAAPGVVPEGWRQIRFSQEGIGWIRVSSLLLL
jgi:tetratricopeptide (TPR) repeat protein